MVHLRADQFKDSHVYLRRPELEEDLEIPDPAAEATRQVQIDQQEEDNVHLQVSEGHSKQNL